MKKVFKGCEKSWNSFVKPILNTLAPVIGRALELNQIIYRSVKLVQFFLEYSSWEDIEFNRYAWQETSFKGKVIQFNYSFHIKGLKKN